MQNLDVPFVIDEWNETPGSGCVPNAPSVVPTFLNYVQRLHLGLIAWALTPGSLIRGNGDPAAPWDWTKPTRFDQATQSCVDYLAYPEFNPQAQGAGELIMNFLAAHSVLETSS